MHIVRIDRQRRLHLHEAIEINIGNHETWWAAICVLKDPLKIAFDGNSRPGKTMKNWDLLRLKQPAMIIRLCHSLQQRRQESYDVGNSFLVFLVVDDGVALCFCHCFFFLLVGLGWFGCLSFCSQLSWAVSYKIQCWFRLLIVLGQETNSQNFKRGGRGGLAVFGPPRLK